MSNLKQECLYGIGSMQECAMPKEDIDELINQNLQEQFATKLEDFYGIIDFEPIVINLPQSTVPHEGPVVVEHVDIFQDMFVAEPIQLQDVIQDAWDGLQQLRMEQDDIHADDNELFFAEGDYNPNDINWDNMLPEITQLANALYEYRDEIAGGDELLFAGQDMLPELTAEELAIVQSFALQ